MPDIVLKKQRSTSNSSSESSGESSLNSGNGGGGEESGHGSPMSPASNPSLAAQARAFGSPVKSGNGTKGTIAKLELFRQGGTQYEPQTMVTRNLREESTINTTAGNYVHVSGSKNNIVGNGNNDVIFYIERPLEKIEERHSESETEIDKDTEDENEPTDDQELSLIEEEGTMTDATSKENATQNKETGTQGTKYNQDGEIMGSENDISVSLSDLKKTKLAVTLGKNTIPTVHNKDAKSSVVSSGARADDIFVKRRLSEHKSFEMEDIPDENPIRCHPEGFAQIQNHKGGRKFTHPHHASSQQLPPRHFHHKQPRHINENLRHRARHTDQKQLSRKSKNEYPIVRHHPLFAKQPKPGGQSNFSSLLLGQNVRVIRRSKATTVSTPEDNVYPGGETMQKLTGFEIFNPETDDLSDSDEELDDGRFDDENNDTDWNEPKSTVTPSLSINLNNENVCSQSTSSSSSSSPDSNDSVESVVSARTDDAQRLSAAHMGKKAGSPISPNSKSSSASITPNQSSSFLVSQTSHSPTPVLQQQQLQQPTETTPSILLITEMSDKEEDCNNQNREDNNAVTQKVDKDVTVDEKSVEQNISQQVVEPKTPKSTSPMQHSQSLDEKVQGAKKVDDFSIRSERRRQSLMSLLGENQSVIINIKGKMGVGVGLSSSDSSNSVKTSSRDTSPLDETIKPVKKALGKIQEVPAIEDSFVELEDGMRQCGDDNSELVMRPVIKVNVNRDLDRRFDDPKLEQSSNLDQIDSNPSHSTPKEEGMVFKGNENILSLSSTDTSNVLSKHLKDDRDELIGKLTGAKPKKTAVSKDATTSEKTLDTGKEVQSPNLVKTKSATLSYIMTPIASSNGSSPNLLKGSTISPGMRLPRPANRGRLDKARSVSPSSCATPHEVKVFRQSSVPTRFDEVLVQEQQSEFRAIKGHGRESIHVRRGKLLQPCILEEDWKKSQPTNQIDIVSPIASDVSGSALQSSRESLCGSFESYEPHRHQISSGKSKSPSPSRSEKSRNSSGTVNSIDGDAKKKEKTQSLPRESNLSPNIKTETDVQVSSVTSKKYPIPQKELSLSEFMATLPRTSNDDLLATEYLLCGKALEPKSSGSSRSMSKESSVECPVDPNLCFEKLSDLDPRYNDTKRRGSSGASTSIIGSCNSDTDTTSQSGIAATLPYRRFDITNPAHVAPSRSHRKSAARDDSIESTTSLGIVSAKSSVQYSDTSSLQSHRFSTISMSSNVSSSDISFGRMTSGSSSYLASMSSADFDDCPIEGGSAHRFLTTSLSEADETDYLSTENKTSNLYSIQHNRDALPSSAMVEMNTNTISSTPSVMKTSSMEHYKGSIVKGIPPQGRLGKGNFQEKTRLRSIFQRKQQHHQPSPPPTASASESTKQAFADHHNGKGSSIMSNPSRERKHTLYPRTKLLLPGKGSKDSNISQELGSDGSELTPLPSPLPASLLGDIGAVPPSPGVLTVIERKLPLTQRSRMGTTTSQDTSLDQTTFVENRNMQSDSFEEELFRGLSRDDDIAINDARIGKGL